MSGQDLFWRVFSQQKINCGQQIFVEIKGGIKLFKFNRNTDTHARNGHCNLYTQPAKS